MRLKQLLLCLFSFLSVAASAQVYPVQVTVQAISPYPIYLSDFTQGMSDRLRVQLLLTDVHVQSRRVRLKMSLTGGGLSLVNPDVVNGALPIELNGGMPEYMGNDRLAPYFNPQNLPGMDPVAYTQPLPEGVYTLCFEAFDFITGEVLSRKSCYTMALIQNDPPLLSLPRNNEGVPQQNPQSLLFQWTPRHLNATNVSYEFSLLELVDTFISPQAAMQVMQPYYQTTTYSTSLWLGPADVPLVPGRKYAWRVRAKSLSGLDELGVFKNNGYSEVWAFTYTDANCAAPMGLLATDIAKRSMKVQWMPLTPGNIGEEITYRISYRLRNNGDRWYDRQTTATELSLFDLDPGTEYELRLGRMCAGTGFVYGNNIYATTAGATDSTVTTSCGLPPAEVDISNQAPLAAMNAGENFTAGDFKVTALQVSGAGGTYSGDGYITVPYLANAKIKVKFNNIFINSERKLAQGFVETTYDPTMSGILDLDDIFEGGTGTGTTVTGEVVTDYQTNFPIGGPGNIVVTGPDDNPSITIQNVTNGGGSGLTISPDSLPVSIADSNGDIYTVEPGNDGAPVITKAGEQAPMQMTPAQLNNLASNKGKVLFTRNNNTQYAFDAYKPEYGASVLWAGKYESLGNEYRVAAKATLPGKPDRITAQITITDNSLIADSVQFVTGKGTRYTSKHLSGNEYEVMMVGSPANDAQELYAVYPLPVNSPADSGKYLSLGKLLVAAYGPKTAKVVVVPVNGGVADTAAIAAKLNATYNGIGIKWEVQQAAPWNDSTWDADHNGKLSVTGSSAWSVYTPEMEALNTAYKTSHTLVSGAAYLFALPQAAEAGVAGDMPRGKRYGYLFTNNLSDAGRVASHEIGHGMFALKHTFDNAYGFAQGALSDNIMSYGSGNVLSKLQWDAAHAPGLVIGVFEGDEDGMITSNAFFWTPSGHIIYVGDAEKGITDYKTIDRGEMPNGALNGFAINGKSYSAKIENGTFYGYVDNSGTLFSDETSSKLNALQAQHKTEVPVVSRIYIGKCTVDDYENMVSIGQLSVASDYNEGYPVGANSYFGQRTKKLSSASITGCPEDAVDYNSLSQVGKTIYDANTFRVPEHDRAVLLKIAALADKLGLDTYNDFVYKQKNDGNMFWSNENPNVPYSLTALQATYDNFKKFSDAIERLKYHAYPTVDDLESDVQDNFQVTKGSDNIFSFPSDPRFVNLLMKPFGLLSLSRKKELLDLMKTASFTVLQNIGQDVDAGYILNAIFLAAKGSPQSEQKALIDYIHQKKYLKHFVEDLYGFQYEGFMNSMLSMVMKSYPAPAFSLNVETPNFLTFNPALLQLNSENFRADGKISLEVKRWFDDNKYTVVANPYDYVTVEFVKDTDFGTNLTFRKGSKVRLPMIWAYQLFWKDTKAGRWATARITAEVALTVCGVGEVAMALRAIRAGRTAYGAFMAVKAVGDIGFGLSDIYITNTPNTLTAKQMKRWNTFFTLWSVGSLSTTAIDGLVTRLGKKSIDNAGDWAKFEQEFPDAELNRLRNESQYAEYIDEIPTGNWTTMLSSMQSSHPNVWNKVKAWTNTALQEKFVAHFGTQGEVLTHINGSNKLDDMLASWQQIATDYQNLSGSFGNLSKANKIKFLDDFAGAPASKFAALDNEVDLLDVWKNIHRSTNIDVLQAAKRLKNKSYVSSATRNDGDIFENDIAAVLDDLGISTIRNKGIPPRTGVHTGGEIDIQTDNILFELTVGSGSKLNQIAKYISNASDFNPLGKNIVLYGPKYTNNAAKAAIENLSTSSVKVTVINELEDFLKLFR